MLCGSACVKYVLDYYNLKYNLNCNMIWISELALELINNSINIDVLCYDSSLYNDYIVNKDKKNSFDGFKCLDKLEKTNKVVEKKLTKNILKKEIKANTFVILCVESRLLNNDDSFSGGHFVILKELLNDNIKVINPIKDKYEIKYININDIINMCSNFGSWRILIKELKND